jgi:hypothetical protein
MRIAALVSVIANCCPCDDYETSAQRDEEADALFHQDPRWLGGDGAYSIDLGDDRTLWLFGDSFIATSPALTRRESTLVRNSVAVMTGRDPRTAAMELAWRDGTPPSSFFAEDGEHWYWPMHGVRTPHGPLVIFLTRVRAAPGEALGFAIDGYTAVRIADPSGPPGAWVIEPLAAPPVPGAPEATVGNCTIVEGQDLYAMSVDGAHAGRMARFSLAALAAGDLSAPEWRTGLGFQPEAERTEAPTILMEDASTECSLGEGEDGDTYVHVASHGFGASTIGFQEVDRIGDDFWGPVDVFTPPESAGERPFVYAAKAHPHLASGSDGLFLVTYVDNSFRFEDLLDPVLEKTLYWPKFVRVKFRSGC